MNRKQLASVIIILSLLPLMSLTVYANSSWHWFTRNPLPMLPFAIVGTIIAEIFMVCYINQIKKTVKAAIAIVLGNIISFLTPYVFVGLTPTLFEDNASFFSRIEDMANKFPFYIVGIVFLILTLIVETPVVYNVLKSNAQNKKRLLLSILIANTITTIIVAIIERVLYKGSW